MAWCEIEPGTAPPVLALACDPSENDLGKALPGATYKAEDKMWRAPLSWPAVCCLDAIWAYQPLTRYPEFLAYKSARQAEAIARVQSSMAMDAHPDLAMWLDDTEHPDGPRLTGPQRGTVDFLTRWRRCILADARGTGKTPPLIRSLQALAARGEAFPALVACPDSAPLAWARKIARWAPEIRVAVVGSGMTAPKRAAAIEAVRDGQADVLIITWSLLRLHTRLGLYPGKAYVKCNDHGGVQGKTAAWCEVHPKELNTVKADGKTVGGWLKTVIADEAHRMADPEAKQTRAMWFLAHHCENFWAVTGTPIVNSVGDLWSILHAIDPLAWPVRSKYLDLFAEQAFAWQNRGKEVLGLRADNSGAFRWAVDPLIRRVPEQIAREGQPLIAPPEFRYPAWTPTQRKAYKAFQTQGLAELDEITTVVPENTAVKYTRMNQLSSAVLVATDGEDAHGFSRDVIRLAMPSNKVADLIDFLEDEGQADLERGTTGAWIVACESLQVIELAQAALSDPKVGVTWTRIVGGMTSPEKDAAAMAFENGEYQVIFITPGAGGESNDLPRADGVLWLAPPSSWVVREQVNGRADRFGRPTHARQVYMITPGSVDPRLFALSAMRQRRNAELVLDAETLRYLMSAADGEIVTAEDDNHDAELV